MNATGPVSCMSNRSEPGADCFTAPRQRAIVVGRNSSAIRTIRCRSPRAAVDAAPTRARPRPRRARANVSRRTLSGMSQVLAVTRGQQDRADSGAVRRDDLLLDAADGRHEPRRLISQSSRRPLHLARSSATAAPCKLYTGAQAVLGDRAGGHVRGCRSSEDHRVDRQRDRLGLHEAQRGLRSFMTSPNCPVRISLPEPRGSASPR